MTQQLVKLDPTFVYLRGVDGYGAFASIHSASSSGFTATGVFRDFADFAVIVLADEANGNFDHGAYLRSLPDYDYTGLTLSFDLTTTGLWPIDSRYYATTDALRLDVITHDLTSGAEQPIICSLWQNAKLKSGTFTAATASLTITRDPDVNDVLTLFVGNTAFQYAAAVGDTATTAASSLTYQINNYDWSTFAQASVSVFAIWNGSNGLTLTFARTGKVSVSGTSVTWQANGTYPTTLPSEVFVGLQPGDPIFIAGALYNIASLLDSEHLTVTSAPPATASATYLAPMGGTDGNALTCYITMGPSNTSLTVSSTTLNFSGAVSDGITWTITLPFGSLNGVIPSDAAKAGAPQHPAGALRQAWITLAPQINAGGQYADTQWSCVIANWTVTGTNRNLYIAGPGSVRIGSQSSWAKYTGAWTQDAENIRYLGFAMVSSTSGDSIIVQYSCGQSHDLYIGTEIYVDRQIVNVSLDGDTNTQLDTYANESSPIPVRRKVRSSVASGTHFLTITLNGTHNASAVPAAGLYSFLFDFLEAVVPGLVQDPSVTYSNFTAALDYDTYVYQVTPSRVVWQLQRLGLLGKVNLDLGVFWLYNRIRIGGSFSSATATFHSGWQNGDSVVLNLGGFLIGKSVVAGDNSQSIAAHFAYYINSASSAFWAASASGVLTITQRSFGSEYTASVAVTVTTSGSASATLSSGSIPAGVEGTWQINDSATPLLNVGIAAWLADFYAQLAANSMQCVTAVTMELVQPPAGYSAKFTDGTSVTTATGFGTLTSEQSAVAGTKVVALQIETFKEIVALMVAAGLMPWLQFGEQQYWYFSKSQSIPIGYVANTYPATIDTDGPHGLSSGQTAVIVGAEPSAGASPVTINGTWTVTVTSPTQFTIPTAGANWVSGGYVSGGGMALYDSDTSAAALTALGRPLVSFYSQDDDPTLNPADVTFLKNRLFVNHYQAIIGGVKGTYPTAKFELLYPCDVNHSPTVWNQSWPYAQGGRLNRALSWPSQLQAKATSGFDALLIEALSWGASYRSIDLAKEAMAWPFTAPNSWSFGDVSFLFAWFNGGTCWNSDYLNAINYGILQIRAWAMDQLNTQSWPLPLPVNQSSVTSS